MTASNNPVKIDKPRIIQHALNIAEGYRLLPPAALTRGPSGVHLGSGSGTSIDFHDFREYMPGDDLRRVDWGAYARSEALMIRLYREEISPVAEIMLDCSASMGAYPGKMAAAISICAFLAGAARRSEGRPVLLIGTDRYTGAAFEAGLEKAEFAGAVNPPQAPHPRPGAHGKPVRFIVSDFLFPADFENFFRRIGKDSAAVVPLQLLSDCEKNPELRGGVRLVDAEDETHRRDLRVERTVLERYRQRLAIHIGQINDAARTLETKLVEAGCREELESPADIASSVADALTAAGIVEVA